MDDHFFGDDDEKRIRTDAYAESIPSDDDGSSSELDYGKEMGALRETLKNKEFMDDETNFLVPLFPFGFEGIIMAIHLGKMYMRSFGNRSYSTYFTRFKTKRIFI